MCGITGWVDWREDLSNQQHILQAMANRIKHRGPDAEGFWLSPRAAFAHRRLIVIDPKGGAQPKTYKAGDDTFAITYNGEIYNFRELREILQKNGHTFETCSDTEVLLHAYLEWKEDCVQHLNGIFAFAIWDDQKQQLFLARDHLGVKPLFYTERNDSIIFGSEIKALLAHPSVSAEIDESGINEIFGLGSFRTPGCGVLKHIKEVRAGHYITFTEDKKAVKRYWTLTSKKHTATPEETASHILSILQDTVKRQLIADVPLVCMLSGGLDSSGITALAGKEFAKENKTLHTYSIDFVNSAKDFELTFSRTGLDAPWVKRVSEHVGTTHHDIIVNAEELANHLFVPLYAKDLPGAGEIETSLYLLFQEMKKDATVALSGESADEVFGGYPWFHQEELLYVDQFPWLTNWKNSSFLLQNEVKKQSNLDHYIHNRFQEAIQEVPILPDENKKEAKQRQMFYLFLTRFLPFLLDRKDRMSMAVGFEVRVPFCDYRLVEYLWNVPFEVKRIDHIEKGILRRALQSVLPDDVRNRRKSAYPTSQDPNYLQAIRNLTLDMCSNKNNPIFSLIDHSALLAIANQTNQEINDLDARSTMEYMLQTNEWLKSYHIRIR
ncbi:asparagine synthase (glutamine-hydrolyzing) [Bacillus cytotoxicus]|uniref:asparagine synthase (glutamine-hydrolyzing) n=1 Tax=Bacillus cytotoxicus TaxID=580165 RepID=UPI00086442C4|nr:asparagine synthase (glutamine-hydrolyzing) [Bacillus cytotoxicus]AWC28342.1 asparagine synthase (glutamine-hydrolyzing) [Bacillus cytotoxicus]AWC40273.1 asparagine synthase (glutamine-hydrolyzing) [Bacillus cytotoxicus]AWC48204.1 asparagine synthase (glutamine-hydrolyzing) [Bacillus cytotoxicus]AWC52409.1 asparagine synthase (glutamine-hydrolyzing) [Bacillus cytotoxicus]AWC56543.1 asparagine synthase (glutamine-hydrolyzing) [Bacillus cytotoxicus]